MIVIFSGAALVEQAGFAGALAGFSVVETDAVLAWGTSTAVFRLVFYSLIGAVLSSVIWAILGFIFGLITENIRGSIKGGVKAGVLGSAIAGFMAGLLYLGAGDLPSDLEVQRPTGMYLSILLGILGGGFLATIIFFGWLWRQALRASTKEINVKETSIYNGSANGEASEADPAHR